MVKKCEDAADEMASLSTPQRFDSLKLEKSSDNSDQMISSSKLDNHQNDDDRIQGYPIGAIGDKGKDSLKRKTATISLRDSNAGTPTVENPMEPGSYSPPSRVAAVRVSKGSSKADGSAANKTVVDVVSRSRPGAVREGGTSLLAAPAWESGYGVLEAEPEKQPEEVSSTDVEVVVPVEAKLVRDEDIENQVEERFRQRADELADHFMERLRQNVVEAKEVEPMKEPDETTAKIMATNKRRRILLCSLSVVCGLIVTIVVVVVVVTRRRSTGSNAKLLPTAAPTLSFPKLPDLQSNSSASIVELISSSANYTILTKSLDLYKNLDLTGLLNSENITLFAPEDERFMELRKNPAYELYFVEQADAFWQYHFVVLITTHITTESVTAAEIFEANSLPTIIPTLTLNVNLTSRTIANGAMFVKSNIKASNGYIHVPDRVLVVKPLRDTLLDYIMNEDYVFSDKITSFRTLLKLTGLGNYLLQALPFGLSVFVPTDAAFDALNQTLRQSLFTNPNSTFTNDVVLYHMLVRNVFNVTAELQFFMLNSVSAWFTTNGNTLINGAQSNDVYIAQNGYVHIIDQVLLPPNVGEMLEIATNVTESLNFATFVDLAKGPAQMGNLLRAEVEGYPDLGKVTTEDYLTVFAPLEDAFASYSTEFSRWSQPDWLLHLQSVVAHHFTVITFPDSVGEYEITMLSGFNATVQVWSAGNDFDPSNKTVDGTIPVVPVPTSIYSDIIAYDGLIYVVDGIILPPWASSSIAEQLEQDPDFSSLVEFIKALESVAALLSETEGPLTLLAPSNEALASLVGTTSNVTFLNDFLYGHILRGNLYTSILNSTVETWNNQTLQVKISGNETYVGGVKLLRSNWLASNGVIHVIDGVLV